MNFLTSFFSKYDLVYIFKWQWIDYLSKQNFESCLELVVTLLVLFIIGEFTDMNSNSKSVTGFFASSCSNLGNASIQACSTFVEINDRPTNNLSCFFLWSNNEIATFCERSYGVSFQLFQKSSSQRFWGVGRLLGSNVIQLQAKPHPVCHWRWNLESRKSRLTARCVISLPRLDF